MYVQGKLIKTDRDHFTVNNIPSDQLNYKRWNTKPRLIYSKQ